MSNAKPIKLKVNVTRVLKEHLYAGKNGKYLDLVAWPNKNGIDQYGNTHFVCQEISREARDRGEKGPIIGNLSLPVENTPRPAPPPQRRAGDEPEPETWVDESSDVPF